MKINFREPNIDRFLSLIEFYHQMYNKPAKYAFLNAPKLYLDHIKGLNITRPCTLDAADFYIEHPVKLNFNKLFGKENLYTPDDPIEMPATEQLDSSSLALLKKADERLELNKDQVQNILDMSYIIGCFDQSEIKVEHVAEAIQYIKY